MQSGRITETSNRDLSATRRTCHCDEFACLQWVQEILLLLLVMLSVMLNNMKILVLVNGYGLVGREVLKLFGGQYFAGKSHWVWWGNGLVQGGGLWRRWMAYELEEVLRPPLDIRVPLKSIAAKIVRRQQKSAQKPACKTCDWWLWISTSTFWTKLSHSKSSIFIAKVPGSLL